MSVVSRILVTAFVAITAIIGVGVYLSARDDGPVPGAAADGAPGQLVREDSHRLNSAPDSDVTLVEFIDFECEGCRAAYPMVEQLRSEYGDRVNIVLRYFPLPSHYNAERAARAVEAAAQQGQLEPMYQRMFATQGQWGERRTPADDVFRGFADDIGLDMAAYDAVYDDPATLARVRSDVADGTALGVQGTPTFFLDGEKLQFRGYDELKSAVDKAFANAA